MAGGRVRDESEGDGQKGRHQNKTDEKHIGPVKPLSWVSSVYVGEDLPSVRRLPLGEVYWIDGYEVYGFIITNGLPSKISNPTVHGQSGLYQKCLLATFVNIKKIFNSRLNSEIIKFVTWSLKTFVKGSLFDFYLGRTFKMSKGYDFCQVNQVK